MKIYLASSWRNEQQPEVLKELREAGHQVYDFRNPEGGTGFGWSQIDPGWQSWSCSEFIVNLQHPLAQSGFKSDMDALHWCDACVLLMPCGRSAHLELGWAAGAGKVTAVLLAGASEPELMYLMNNAMFTETQHLLEWLDIAAWPGKLGPIA